MRCLVGVIQVLAPILLQMSSHTSSPRRRRRTGAAKPKEKVSKDATPSRQPSRRMLDVAVRILKEHCLEVSTDAIFADGHSDMPQYQRGKELNERSRRTLMERRPPGWAKRGERARGNLWANHRARVRKRNREKVQRRKRRQRCVCLAVYFHGSVMVQS